MRDAWHAKGSPKNGSGGEEGSVTVREANQVYHRADNAIEHIVNLLAAA